MNVASVGRQRIGQRQTPPGEITKAGLVTENLDAIARGVYSNGSTFARRHDASERVVTRDGQHEVHPPNLKESPGSTLLVTL